MSKLIPLLTLILFALASRPPSPISSPPVSRPPSPVPSALSPGQLLAAFPTPNGNALIVSYRTDAGNAVLDLTYLSPDATQTQEIIPLPSAPASVIVIPCGNHVTIATNDQTNPINAYQTTPPPGFTFPCPASPQTYLPIITAAP